MTAGRFNPNNPSVLGNEWYVTSNYTYALDTTGSVIACHFVADTTEDLDAVGIYLSEVTGCTGTWGCELLFGGLTGAVAVQPASLLSYDNGTDQTYLPAYNSNGVDAGVVYLGIDIPSTGTGAVFYEPATDATTVNMINWAGSGAGPFAPELLQMYQNDTTSKGVIFASSNSEYACYTSALKSLRTLSGRRIISVQVVGYMSWFGAQSLRPYLKMNGTKYQGSTWTDSVATGQSTWYVDPSTNAPWTQSAVEAFATSTNVWGFKASGAGGGGGLYVALYECALVVNFADENRMGLGTLTSLTEAAWNNFTLNTPEYFNLLWADESSFETATGAWTATSANTTLTQSATVAFNGTKSLRVEATVAGTKTVGTGTTPITRKIPVTAGRTYYLSAELRAIVTTRSCTVGIQWYNQVDALLGTATSGAANDSTAAWTLYTVSGVAPAGACFARVIVTITSQGIAPEYHFIDGVMLTVNKSYGTFVLGGSANTIVPKTSGDDLVWMFRHYPNGSATGPNVGILDSGDTVPMDPGNEVAAYTPTIGTLAGNITSMGNAATGMFGLRPYLAGTVNAADGFPYAVLTPLSVWLQSPTRTYQQAITSPTVRSYGFVRVCVSLVTVDTTADLTVKIKRTSDNVQFGPTMTFAAADLVVPRAGPQIISIPIGQLVSLAAVSYYFEFTSTGATQLTGWYVYACDSQGAQNALGYGGITDTVLLSTGGGAAVGSANLDAIATLATIPDTPKCFTVTTY